MHVNLLRKGLLLQAAKEVSVQTILIPHEQRRKRIGVASYEAVQLRFRPPLASVLRMSPDERLILMNGEEIATYVGC
jgi:hypothetical protein